MLGRYTSSLVSKGVILQLWQPIPLTTSLPSSGNETENENVAVTPSPTPLPAAPSDPDYSGLYGPRPGGVLDIYRASVVVSNTSNEDLQQVEVSLSSPVAVVAGDFLGIRQSPRSESKFSLHYQEGGGPQAYTAATSDCSFGCSLIIDRLLEVGSYDYPLIAVHFTSAGVI